jgi:hypothetical protein
MSAAPGRLGVLLVLALALVATACSGDDDNESQASKQKSSTTTSATVTAADPTTSTSVPGPERIEATVVRLLQSRNEAFRQPDPARVDEYLSSGCSCYEDERATLQNLQSRGWHWETPMFEVLGVRVVEQDRPGLATLTVVARRPPERVVDANGALVKPAGSGQKPTGYSILLVQRDGAWRIGDNAELDLRPDLLDEIIREGVPS